MPRPSAVTLATLLATAGFLLPARAQEAPKPESKPAEAARPAERRPPGATLRVQVVISRFQGDKKVASLPYVFTVTVDGRPARMRMGVDTPVAVAAAAGDGGKPMTTSFQYRNVGTNIDCGARDAGEGRYQLMLSIENSSALPAASTDAGTSANPLFRRFDTNIDPVLRDGQSLQTIASTDPVTGEVVKIDVTMSVVK